MSTPSPSLLALPPYATTSPARLQALYSDISRQKLSNPTSYHSSIEWWRKVLDLIVSSGLQQDGSSRLVLNAGWRLMELVKVAGVGKPLALNAVITELRTRKSLIPESEFLSVRGSIYEPGWLPTRVAAFVVGKPLWWMLEQIGLVGDEGVLGGASRDDKDKGWWGEYVVVAVVEKAADEVLKRQRAKAGGAGDRLYSFEGFRKEFGAVLGQEWMTAGDAKVLLKFLERDRRVVMFDEKVIKFIANDVTGELREINTVDRGILDLKTAVENLHAQVDGLHQKIDECKLRATAALRQKYKPVALSYLRLQKQLKDLLAKRLGSLDTLESTLIQVEAAAGDLEIMKLYGSSSATLRAILSHPSLQRESIDTTMEALAEANADAREVDEAITSGGDIALGVQDVVDEEELEEELKGLIEVAEREAKAENEESEDVKRRLEEARLQVPSGSLVPHKESEVRDRQGLAVS